MISTPVCSSVRYAWADLPSGVDVDAGDKDGFSASGETDLRASDSTSAVSSKSEANLVMA